MANIKNFFTKKFTKENQTVKSHKEDESRDAAKERLQLVLMQDRASVSADFLELMRQDIIDVIKKYVEVDENTINVKLANIPNDDGTVGTPSLYAEIPILGIKNETRKFSAVAPENDIEPMTREEIDSIGTRDAEIRKEKIDEDLNVEEDISQSERESEEEKVVEDIPIEELPVEDLPTIEEHFEEKHEEKRQEEFERREPNKFNRPKSARGRHKHKKNNMK